MKKLTLFFFLLTLATYGQTPCSPISTLDCSDIVVGLPYNLDFSASTTNTITDATGFGTGFTAVMEHSEARTSADLPISNPNVNGYEPSLLALTGGTLQLVSQKGIAYLNPPSSYRNNNQVNTLGVGLQNITDPITIKTTLLNIVAGGGSAQSGLWFGYDEDNFVKLDIDNGAVEIRVESNGVSTNNKSVSAGVIGNNVTLELEINPNTLTASGYYTVGSGAKTLVQTYSIPADYISGRTIGASNMTFAGIYATHRNGTQFTATYDSFSVSGPPDNQNPTAPSLSSNTNTDTSVDLNWTAATDNVAVTGYKVFINGVLETTLGNVLTYQKTGLTASTAYTFTVVALDAAGNEGTSNDIQVTTNASTSTGGTTTELVLSLVNKTSTTVNLSWVDNSGLDVSRYGIYKNGELETYIGNVSTFQVTDLIANTPYEFTITSIGSSGESTPSNIISTTTNSTSGVNTGSGYWNINNQDVYYNDGRIGIGTDSPASTLHVIGNSNITGELVLGDVNGARTEFGIDSNHKIFAATNETTINLDGDWNGGGFVAVYRDDAHNGEGSISMHANLNAKQYKLTVDEFRLDGSINPNKSAILISKLEDGDSQAITGLQLNTTNSVLVVGDVIGYEKNKGYGIVNKFKTKLENDLYLSSGKIGIGVESSLIPAEYDLAVAGKIISEEVKVQLIGSTGTWPDYVFDTNYKLPSLTEVEAYIKAKGHLKNIPSANDVSKNGILLGNMNAKLLEKIEELTLYTIQQQKALEAQSQKNKTLEERLAKLEMLLETIGK
ncbi:fibronectin type III domain-containing protein [uncultured Algibacter sp.]|uniref:fibronectin type III domain-containing protein n=1 Tax=uncultured Algibacter sp. TaxID=298659 RepID=UPI003217E4D9